MTLYKLRLALTCVVSVSSMFIFIRHFASMAWQYCTCYDTILLKYHDKQSQVQKPVSCSHSSYRFHAIATGGPFSRFCYQLAILFPTVCTSDTFFPRLLPDSNFLRLQRRQLFPCMQPDCFLHCLTLSK